MNLWLAETSDTSVRPRIESGAGAEVSKGGPNGAASVHGSIPHHERMRVFGSEGCNTGERQWFMGRRIRRSTLRPDERQYMDVPAGGRSMDGSLP
jgi:hypothetical protein